MACKKTYSIECSQPVQGQPSPMLLNFSDWMRTGHSAWNGHRTIHTQTSFLYTETLSRGLGYCGTQSTLAYCKRTVYPTLIRTGRLVGICVPCWNAKDISTRYSQVVTHPSTNPAQSCLTSVITREPVHSAWYGLRTLHCTHKHLLNAHTHWQEDWAMYCG